ncbi:MAG: hypothetical protein K2H70_05825, partial [Bacteroidales bacterium]|nr:hypothetical protein [Bacteroidales bacterium]
GETEVSKAAEYSFKMPASDLNYTAKFEKPKYELTLAPSSPRAGSVEGAGSYEADENVSIKATPNENYVFVAWMKGTDTISREAEYTFKMPAEKTHYMALFKINRTEYELTLTATPENAGTVTGGGSYEADADVTIKATPNDGFVFVAWMNGNDTLSREAEYPFKMPAENTAYTALFAAKQVANEDVLRANFNLYAKDGRLHIRNLAGLTIASVDVYGLNGQRLNRFAPNSREDLSLAVAAERALVFVRIDTERGAVVYKIYLP